MLYNKNNVRKTNDKKVLHKIGKQWKVVSAALLMAVAGGAVATHANANADASNNAEANTIAGTKYINGNTITPQKQPSSASEEVKRPASNISYFPGYNGSAASYHADAQNDEANYQSNSKVVNSYVNSLNAKFPSEANSLNNNYNSAVDKANADKSNATSYSNIANGKDYSSQVSTLASKAGLTYSGFIQSVSARASDYNDSISYGSDLSSQMNVVNSYAQLIKDIDNNSALSNEYAAKSVSASANQRVAADNEVAASSVYDHFVNASATYQNALNNAKAASTANSEAEDIARVYAGLDAATTNSIASRLGFKNSSETSVETHSLVDPLNDVDYYNDNNSVVYSNGSTTLALSAASYSDGDLDTAQVSANNVYTLLSDTSEEDQYNSLSAEYNNEIASYSRDSASVSDALNSASAGLNSANNNLSSANSVSDAYAILGNNPRLSQLFNHVDNELTGYTINGKSNGNDAIIYKNYRAFGPLASVVRDALNAQGISDNSSRDDVANAIENITSSIAADLNKAGYYNQNDVKAPKGNSTDVTNAQNALQSAESKSDADASALSNADAIYSSANSALNSTVSVMHTPVSLDTSIQVINEVLSANNAFSGLNYADQSDKAAVNNAQSNVSNDSVAVQNAQSALDAAKSKGTSVKPNNNDNGFNYYNNGDRTVKDILNDMSAKNANNATVRADLTQFDDVLNNAAKFGNNIIAGSDKASVSPSAYPDAVAHYNKVVTSAGILNAEDYADASNAVSTYLEDPTSVGASDIASVAASAATNYTSTESASASYSTAVDENVTLAGIYANSYLADVNSDQAVVSAAKNSLDGFYLTHADANYANASSVATAASAEYTNDTALAHANGLHVYNYGPKYITMTNDAKLHSATDFSKNNIINNVPKGTELAVQGVGFSISGVIRYVVNYGGHKGYITAQPNYTEYTFAPAQNNVSVTVNHQAYVYKDAKFNEPTGKSISAGTTVNNVSIITMDNINGGFTRVESNNGDAYFTSNTKYITVNSNNNVTNNGNNNEVNGINGNHLISYFDSNN